MTAHPRCFTALVLSDTNVSRTRAYNVNRPFAVQPSTPLRGYLNIFVTTKYELPLHDQFIYVFADFVQPESKNRLAFAVVVNVSKLLAVPFVYANVVPLAVCAKSDA